jgi:hypothetical protein
MDNSSKTIGESLRRIFSAIIRRPMGWTLIDAFASLEEREEAVRPGAETNESESVSTPPGSTPREPVG